MSNKILLGLALLLAATSSAFGQTPRTTPKAPTAQLVRLRAMATTGGGFTSVLFNWQYVPLANVPACPSNGTPKSCYNGFTLTDTSSGSVLATAAVLGTTAVTYTWTPATGLPFGTINFSLITTGFDQNGNPIESSPVTVSVTNSLTTLNGPTNFTGTLQ